jgi:predicted NAD/FAD-binding protein
MPRPGPCRSAIRSPSTTARSGQGGHSHTVSIDYDGTPISVDTGFIVYNELNYPGLTALFDHLGVETVEAA